MGSKERLLLNWKKKYSLAGLDRSDVQVLLELVSCNSDTDSLAFLVQLDHGDAVYSSLYNWTCLADITKVYANCGRGDKGHSVSSTDSNHKETNSKTT